MKKHGLVIRYFMGGFFICTGQPPKGIEPEKGELYIGETVKFFDTHDEAKAMLDLIDAAYGFQRKAK